MSQLELDPRNQEAIQAALEGIWEKAVSLNNELVTDFPENIDVLNRLAKAYTELGQINKARQTYEKVLETDPYNPIAMRNLDRLSALRGQGKVETASKPLDPEVFLEEPGKTKTIDLTDLAMTSVLVTLRVGDNVELRAGKENVSAVSSSGQRLGKLENTWGKEIALAMNLGSTFNAVIKSLQISKDEKKTLVSIFVRETNRSKKLANPLFPIDTNFTPYVRENTLSYLKNEEPVITETSDETAEVEVEDLPTEDYDENLPSTPDIIEDEEDFAP